MYLILCYTVLRNMMHVAKVTSEIWAQHCDACKWHVAVLLGHIIPSPDKIAICCQATAVSYYLLEFSSVAHSCINYILIYILKCL